MKELIKGIDIYGASYEFRIQNSTSIKSLIGGAMTLITVGFFAFVFVIFGHDFYMKLNPKVLIQDKIHSDEQLYKLNNYTVKGKILVLKIRKEMSVLLDWMLDANVPYSFQNEKILDTMKKCNDSYVFEMFYQNNEDYGKQQMLDNEFLCYDIGTNKFGLHDSAGGQGNILVSPMSIWSYKCGVNYWGIQFKDCPPDYDPNKILSRPEVEVWLQEILFNPDNLDSPYQYTYRRAGKFRLSKNSLSWTYLYIRYHALYDNLGFLMDTEVFKEEIGLGDVEAFSATLDVPLDYFDFKVFIGYDKKFKQYTRTYMKFQDLLALVGGVLKAVFVFFQVLSYFFNNYNLSQYIYEKATATEESKQKNNSMKLDVDSLKNQVKNNPQTKAESSRNKIVNLDISNAVLENKQEKSHVKTQLKTNNFTSDFSNEKKHKIKWPSAWYYFKYLVGLGRSNEYNLQLKYSDSLRSIEFYLQSCLDIEKMKDKLKKSDLSYINLPPDLEEPNKR